MNIFLEIEESRHILDTLLYITRRDNELISFST